MPKTTQNGLDGLGLLSAQTASTFCVCRRRGCLNTNLDMAFAKGKLFVFGGKHSGFCPTCAEPRDKNKIQAPYDRVQNTAKSLAEIANSLNGHAGAAQKLFAVDRESFDALRAFTDEKTEILKLVFDQPTKERDALITDLQNLKETILRPMLSDIIMAAFTNKRKADGDISEFEQVKKKRASSDIAAPSTQLPQEWVAEQAAQLLSSQEAAAPSSQPPQEWVAEQAAQLLSSQEAAAASSQLPQEWVAEEATVAEFGFELLQEETAVQPVMIEEAKELTFQEAAELAAELLSASGQQQNIITVENLKIRFKLSYVNHWTSLIDFSPLYSEIVSTLPTDEMCACKVAPTGLDPTAMLPGRALGGMFSHGDLIFTDGAEDDLDFLDGDFLSL